ncbi:HAMP domain-containing histidine kinase, partial [Massilia arenosa]
PGGPELRIGYARTVRKREQTRSAILRALLPLEGIATLATVGLIWFSVSNGLQPLARLRARLNARSGDDLSPIETGALPAELMPLAAAFNDLLERVRAGAQAQHDFLANVAHQLRTPLAGLKLQLEWLAERHPDDAKSQHSLKLMLSSAERMIRQTNQLLALARAEPSRFEKTRLEPLDLVSLVEESVQYFVEEAARKGIDIGFDVLPTPVSGDRFLLRDLVENLVDNALRYTPPGGTVTVGCRPDGQGGGVFTVEDTGPGIPRDMRERVFSRHVRLDSKTHGSGLGLAIVRDIARAHHASVEVGERRGGGAVFTVYFPG